MFKSIATDQEIMHYKVQVPGSAGSRPLKHGSGGSRGGGGVQGVRTPPLGHDVGFLTLGPKLDPPPFFACRPKMDPSGGSRVQGRIQDFWKGGGVQAQIQDFSQAPPPPWTLSAWRHPPSEKLKTTPTLGHSQAPPLDIARVTSSTFQGGGRVITPVTHTLDPPLGSILGLQAKKGGPTLGPMLKSLHRGPKGGGPDPLPPPWIRHWGLCVWQGWSPRRPPLECGWRHTGNAQGGGACECKFSEGRWRHSDNVQDNVQGGRACEKSCIRAWTPPPFKNPGSAPACAHGPRSIQWRIQDVGNGGGRPSIQVKHVAGGWHNNEMKLSGWTGEGQPPPLDPPLL